MQDTESLEYWEDIAGRAFPMASPYTLKIIAKQIDDAMFVGDFDSDDEAEAYVYNHIEDIMDDCNDDEVLQDLRDAGYLD